MIKFVFYLIGKFIGWSEWNKILVEILLLNLIYNYSLKVENGVKLKCGN